MKKLIALLVALAMIGLVGCGPEQPNTDDNSAKVEETKEEKDKEEAPKEEAKKEKDKEEAPKEETKEEKDKEETPKEETKEEKAKEEPKKETEKTADGKEIKGVELEKADFLTEEQRELVKKGYERIGSFQVGTGIFSGVNEKDNYPSEMVDIDKDGETYHKYGGIVYDSWDAFDKDMLSVFTPEFYKNINTFNGTMAPLYVEHEGGLYYHDGDRGANPEYVKSLFELDEQTEDVIKINCIGYYGDADEIMSGAENPKLLSSEVFHVVLKKTENGWRVDNMELPY